ncbi:hypothetical protein C6496_07660 [Candidatus Poribacteria bacterium]|nr:MAG: hypothetical protein C6496_07660 [Candidatus Poribacteria bacterium]
MKKIIERSKPIVAQTVRLRRRLHKLMERTLLLATLAIAIGFALPLHADTRQLLFDENAIKDPGSLVVKLQDTRAPVSEFIASQLSEDMQWILLGYDGASEPTSQQQKVLLSDLNQLLQMGSLYDPQLFANIELSEQTQTLVTQNPQSGEALIRLNRSLLADVYPYELAALSEEQTDTDFEGIETCRENLRQIKMALDTYRSSNADAYPQWLSELAPQYMDEKVLCCPADPTAGSPGVLTEDASDPMLPCSYLYEIRPSEKDGQHMLQTQEGDMTPIVRCEHHRLNLSVGGKLYRNGPQRDIYNSNKIGFSVLADALRDLRKQHGEGLFKTQKGRENLKQAIEELVLKQFIPQLLNALENEVYTQLETQLGKGILESPMGMDIVRQAMPQVRHQIKEQVQSELETRLGAEFFQTEEGKDILQQLSVLMSSEGIN